MAPAQIKTWSIFASLENADFICSDISTWLMELNISSHLFSIELLAREALNNAIIHGCQMNPAGKIYAELQHDENALRLKIRDDGAGFNWRESLQEDTADDEVENGRGLKLYRLYADQVEFNDSGNQVTLTRLLKSGIPFESFQKK